MKFRGFFSGVKCSNLTPPHSSGVAGTYSTNSVLPSAWREAVGMVCLQMQQSVWNRGAVVALAPNVGSALKRSWQGAGGTVVGAALGIAVMSGVGAAVGSGSYTKHPLRTACPLSFCLMVSLLCMHPKKLRSRKGWHSLHTKLSHKAAPGHLHLLSLHTLLLAQRPLCTLSSPPSTAWQCFKTLACASSCCKAKPQTLGSRRSGALCCWR